MKWTKEKPDCLNKFYWWKPRLNSSRKYLVIIRFGNPNYGSSVDFIFPHEKPWPHLMHKPTWLGEMKGYWSSCPIPEPTEESE